jgi:hypothetical protein
MKKLLVLIFISYSCFALCQSVNSRDSVLNASNTDDSSTIEKVYLHTDRDIYYPGDDIWFKAYLIEVSDMLLSDHSYNLHAELISPSSKIIDSRIIKLDNGLGNGDFKLSGDLASGRYRIRAYTNYMRNFGDQVFFNKDITIINVNDVNKSFKDTLRAIIEKPEITFFPEGGSLVDSVGSIVAFKGVDSDGNGCDVSGGIYSSKGDLITLFKSSHKGMGSFSLVPVTGESYYAVTRDRKGNLTRHNIPPGFPSGIVLSVSGRETGYLALTFRTNRTTLPKIIDTDLSISVSAHNQILKTYSFRMKSLNSFLKVPTDDLPGGIVMLTLADEGNVPLCERLVFINKNEAVKLSLKTNKDSYTRRDSVSVRISLNGISDTVSTASLSLSAFENDYGTGSTLFQSTISSWFLLESDVRGTVEEPSYYFDQSNPNRLNDLDLLLLTQGWRDFKWKYKTPSYFPEYGFTISGRVRKKFADSPVKNSFVNIGIFGRKKPYICVIPTDSSGRFLVKEVNLTGDANLIASITNEKDKFQGWILLDSSKYEPSPVKEQIPQRKSVITDDPLIDGDQNADKDQPVKKNISRFQHYSEFKDSVLQQYRPTDTIDIGEVKINAYDWTKTAKTRSQHYLHTLWPDKEIVITPSELIYNNVTQLLTYKFVLAPSKGFPHGLHAPLYMIDGNRVTADDVVAIPIRWVERIDVVTNPGSQGSLRTIVSINDTTMGYSDGTISIILKSGTDIKPVSYSANVKISGYSEPRTFYAPKHGNPIMNDKKPDLRTTLFWEPDIKVKNNKVVTLNYYNHDIPSTVRICVEGITSTGIPVTGIAEYEIR